MSDTVVISLARFGPLAEHIAYKLDADLLGYEPDVFCTAFAQYRRIVAVMSAGIVVRKVAPLLVDKWTDPAVVVVSPDMAYAIPVVGGHHGANDLACELAALGIQPVITTATETQGLESVEGLATRFGRHVANRDTTREVNAGILDNRTRVYTMQGPAIVLASPGVSFLSRPGIYTVGLGCRLGVTCDEVVTAVRQALDDSGIMPDEVMIYATTEKKIGETGLVQAIEALGGCLIFLDDKTIKVQVPESPSAAGRIGLPGVAEPAALAVSRKRELVMKKRVSGRVTIAIAR
jgi:cobalt-precorrin 5A hydrolase